MNVRNTVGALLAAGATVLVVGLTLVFAPRTAEQVSLPTLQNVRYEVRVSTPTRVTTGTTTTVRVRVLKDGKPFDVEEHDRLLHVMVVSANLRDTFHTFAPEREQLGTYSIEHVFTEPDPYRIWTEVDNTAAEHRHDANAEHIAYAELTARGTEATIPSALIEGSEAIRNGYRIRLSVTPAVAGEPSTLRFTATAEDGRPVSLFPGEPFLYFLSGENFSFFRHGHGSILPDGSAGLVNTFPSPGRYVFWAQISLLQGQEETVEVVVPFLVTITS